MKIRRDRSIGFRRATVFSVGISIQKDLSITDAVGRRCATPNDSKELRTLRFGQVNMIDFIHDIL